MELTWLGQLPQKSCSVVRDSILPATFDTGGPLAGDAEGNERGGDVHHLYAGLMSTTGVPSIASMGPTRSRSPSIVRTTTG